MQAVVEQESVPAGNVNQGCIANDGFHLRHGSHFRVDGCNARQAEECFFGVFLGGTAQGSCRYIGDNRIFFIFQVWAGGLQDITDIILPGGGKKVQIHFLLYWIRFRITCLRACCTCSHGSVASTTTQRSGACCTNSK